MDESDDEKGLNRLREEGEGGRLKETLDPEERFQAEGLNGEVEKLEADEVLDAAQRSRLDQVPDAAQRSRLDELLEELLTDEDEIEGLAAEIEGGAGQDGDESKGPEDLYSLWSAMTVLAQEVKLQGRSFHQLNGTLSEIAKLPESLSVVEAAREETRALAVRSTKAAELLAKELRLEIERESVQRARKAMVETLLDQHERMIRGRDTARAHLEKAKASLSKSWMLRTFGGEVASELIDAAAAHLEGQKMALERLETQMKEFDVSAIACGPGNDFDPKCMNAVDVLVTGEMPEGRVCEVIRTGYMQDGNVVRYCQVVVSQRPVPALVSENRSD